MKPSILVTGGTGYIGSHTVVELQQAGYPVVIIDDLSNSQESVLDGIEQLSGIRPTFFAADLKDEAAVRKVFENHTLAGVIHFAASKAVGESVQKPLLYYKNNFLGMVHVLQMMVEYQVPNLLFSSSCTVYGKPDSLPVTEQSPIKPALSPYGNTKQVGEEIIRDVQFVHPEVQAISLRYFNPIGAHESGLIGENPQGTPNNLLPYLLQVVTGEREQLSVYGDDYDTPDGTCIRDYIHVVDVAKAHVMAMTRLLNKAQAEAYEVFNLGTGTGYSVLDIIKTFEQETGQPVNYRIAPRRYGDIDEIYANTTRANEVLGWKAQYGLPEMLKSAWVYQQQYQTT